jgi:hypothetical protein
MHKLKINFGFLLLLLPCTAKIFCGVINKKDTEIKDLTVYNKDDVFKYWLVKKIDKKQNNSEVFTNKISPLLASLKQSIPKTLFQMHLMEVKILKTCHNKYFAYQEMRQNHFLFPLELQYDSVFGGITSVTLYPESSLFGYQSPHNYR